MSDERRVSRQEGTTVTIDRIKRAFVAEPLPWRKRNDFGDAIIQAYVETLNKAIDQGKEGLIAQLMESNMPYDKLFQLAFPEGSLEDFESLSFREMVEVFKAALDVNDLNRQIYMIDPNLPAPTSPAETEETNGAPTDGQKTTSPQDLSSLELVEPTSTN